MTVKDMIEFLQTQPQDRPIAIRMYSDYDLLELKEIEIKELCFPRADGIIQGKRPDMDCQTYVCFPGN